MKKLIAATFIFALFGCANSNSKNAKSIVDADSLKKTSASNFDTTQLSKTSEMLDENKFWEIVGKSMKHVQNQEDQEQFLIAEIERLNPKEMIGFRLRTDKLLYDTYTSDMWCAGYIMNGGCSDDGFEYFRCWLISKGKDVYYKAKSNPDYLANIVKEGKTEYDFEAFWYVALKAFKNLTGKGLYDYVDENKFIYNESKYPQIVFTWKEDQPETLKKVCPKLFEKFWPK